MEKLLRNKRLNNPLMLSAFMALSHSALLYVAVGFLVFLDQVFKFLDGGTSSDVAGFIAQALSVVMMYYYINYVFKVRNISGSKPVAIKWARFYVGLTLVSFILTKSLSLPFFLMPLVVSFTAFVLATRPEKTAKK